MSSTGAAEIKVRLKDGRTFPARLVGTDEKTDIAVVKIEAADLPVEELADSEAVRVGEIACAIGVPYNQDYSFTSGVVSAKGRRLGMTPRRLRGLHPDRCLHQPRQFAAARWWTSTARLSA